MQAIELRNVSAGYSENTLVLDNISFTVQKGEFLALVGPNGGGKSTLLKILLALLKPWRGEALVLGQSPLKARRRVGYLPQQVNIDPDFPLTIPELVTMGCLGLKLSAAARRERAQAALEQVGLGGENRKRLGELSGGQRQKALIARALAAEPEILLLDEPTAGLDPKAEREFFDLLALLHGQGLTILVVSHDLSFVSPYVGKVVCVKCQVMVHPVGELAPEIISHLYGRPMRPVLHHISGQAHGAAPVKG
ncbi:MAG: metal ABC transporter ATP-binding protein [Desulfarculales bacterium]|jgi:zinc transport system ATP-binding protein|nr:metal ABC transporter ATP-binding protein [Desulfarculales bacterium]